MTISFDRVIRKKSSLANMADTIKRDEAVTDSNNIQEISKDGEAAEDQTNVDGSPVSKPKESQDEAEVSESGDGGDAEWLDVLGSGQLRKKVLKAGQGESSRPDRGQAITVSYKGRLLAGAEVESRDKFTFIQGEGEIVQAIDLCVCLMEVGEVAEIHTDSRFAYSEFGKEPQVPPNTDMVFEVELLEVNPPPSTLAMTVEECCQMADKKREYGNELFGRKDFSGAINSYTRALTLLEDAPGGSDESQDKLVGGLLVKCYNNLAAAQLKVEAFSAALKSCNSALSRDASNVKALFRKGKVLACQKEFAESQTYLKMALAIEPANKTIHQELAKLLARLQQEVQSEKAMYQRMVGDMASVSDKTPTKKWFSAKVLLVGLSAVIVVVAVALGLHLR